MWQNKVHESDLHGVTAVCVYVLIHTFSTLGFMGCLIAPHSQLCDRAQIFPFTSIIMALIINNIDFQVTVVRLCFLLLNKGSHLDFFLYNAWRCCQLSFAPTVTFCCHCDAIILRARSDLRRAYSWRHVWRGFIILPSSRRACPPAFILIKYRSSDVRAHCWHRGPLSHSEVMQRGETEGSLLHNGLINMRTLSLIWFNNCSRIFSVLCWLLGEHTFYFLLFLFFNVQSCCLFLFCAATTCAWCTEMASVYTICNFVRFLLDFRAFTFQRFFFSH